MRLCANCGTEVDGDALFCPTCGQPMEGQAQPELPPAPDWPELPEPPPPEPPVPEPPAPGPPAPEPVVAGTAPAEAGGDEVSEAPPPPFLAAPADAPPEDSILSDQDEAPPDASTHAWEGPVSGQPIPPWRRGAVHRAAEEQVAATAGDADPAEAPPVSSGARGARPAAGPAARRVSPMTPSGIVRIPQLLSDWLAGIGAFTGVLAMFLPWVVGGRYTDAWGLASGVNMVMTVVLVGVLAVVFLSELVPEVPQRGLVMLAIGLVGVGIGFDRLGLPLTGAGGIVFLIATIVLAAGGAVAVLGHDRPVGGPQA